MSPAIIRCRARLTCQLRWRSRCSTARDLVYWDDARARVCAWLLPSQGQELLVRCGQVTEDSRGHQVDMRRQRAEERDERRAAAGPASFAGAQFARFLDDGNAPGPRPVRIAGLTRGEPELG